MAKNEFIKQNFLILGLGVSGKAAAEFLLKQGATVFGFDDYWDKLAREDLAELSAQGLKIVQDPHAIDWKKIQTVVVSPGIPREHSLCQKALHLQIKLTSEIELGIAAFKGKAIGVTGSNGKTTVVQLINHVLVGNGYSSVALGNIGNPLATCDSTKTDIAVIELSSFQVESMQRPVLDMGIILNITPNHLDRYASMELYALAKLNIVNWLKPGGRLFLNETIVTEFGSLLGMGQYTTYSYELDPMTQQIQLNLKGPKQIEKFLLPLELKIDLKHDQKNALIAYVVCRELGVSWEGFLASFKTFQKLPHRLEFVREIQGVRYYNDSKATSLDSVMSAVESFQNQVILIAGGYDKGLAYDVWRQAFRGKVKQVCLIGQTAQKICSALKQEIPTTILPDLGAALAFAKDRSVPGDAILLSPGCSSYDMFKDYKHRGDEFKRLVNLL